MRSTTKFLAGLLGVLAACSSGVAHSETVFVEPDAFPSGTDLRNAFSHVSLSCVGHPATIVRSVSGFSSFNGANLATTGSLVFGQDPAPADPAQGWDRALGVLRADFDVPVDAVSVDVIFDDDDVAVLRAFGSDDQLLEAIRVSGDGRGPNPFTSVRITRHPRHVNGFRLRRKTPDIAYVTVGGISEEAVMLDNLVVHLSENPP